MKTLSAAALRVPLLLAALAMTSMGQTVVDLSDPSIDEGFINGASFRIDSTHPSGTGIFGRNAGGVFLTIQNKGVEEGYNSEAGVMDTKRVPQWNHEISVSSLEVITISNIDYVPFLLDINETDNNKDNLLVLDDVKIFTSAVSGVSDATLDALLADPALTLRYNMDAGANNSVLLDYSRIGSGSGAADMALLVPLSVFQGAALTDTLYLYSKFGGDLQGIAKGDADAGYEEWTQGKGTAPITVPEPATLTACCLGAIGLLMRRRR